MRPRDEVIRLLDDETGLRCLPRFWKRMCLDMATGIGDEVWPDWLKRLSVLVRHVEPLANGPHASPHFSDLCCGLADAGDLAEVAARLGLEVPERPDWLTWLRWADRLQLQSAPCLYCLACFWALPLPGGAVPPDIEAVCRILTASALNILGHRDWAAMVLESHLRLSPDDYADHDTLRTALQRSALNELEANNRATFLRVLADALGFVPGRDSAQAAMLLESHLRGPIFAFAIDPALADVAVTNVMSYLAAWFRAVGPTHLDVVPVCEAVVDRVRTIRDEELRTYQERRNFYEQIPNIWRDVRRITLGRIDWLRGDRPEDAADLERRLLAWGEQFDNRILLARALGLTGPGGEDGAELLPGWTSGARALRRDALVDLSRFREHLPPADPYAWPAALLAPLGVVAAGEQAEPSAAPSFGLSQGSSDPAEDILARKSLEELLPTGSVWVRQMFDADDGLRWWAVRRAHDGIEVLARGRSTRPGARGRLERAVTAFDLDVEWAWNVYQGRTLRTGSAAFDVVTTQLAGRLEQYLRDEERFRRDFPGPGERQAFRDSVVRVVGRADLFRVWPQWCLAALSLADHLRRPDDRRDEPSPVPLELWLRPLNAPPVPAGRNGWRLAELDRATEALLHAVEEEFDLQPLWDEARGRIDWSQTDVLFQVQGPLLAAPLAWLRPDGSTELFRQVASTGSIVSLASRSLGEAQATATGTPPRGLLSAQWLDENDWRRMTGLAWLEAALHRRATRPAAPWDFWALGDDPQASPAALRAALAGRRCAAAVVGGHGDLFESGVALAGGLWRGDGVNLSGLDLLVLVACAVGRLQQSGERDVIGLYAHLLAHRGRTVIAARWPVADVEAAALAAELVHQYATAVENGMAATPFARARALNRARRALLDEGDARYRVGRHLASAFEIYGRG